MHRVKLDEANIICQCDVCHATKNFILSDYLELQKINSPVCCDEPMTPILLGLNLVDLSSKYLKRK